MDNKTSLFRALAARGATALLLLAAASSASATASGPTDRGSLAVVNLAWDWPDPAVAIAGKLSSLVGGWARDPQVALELLGHNTGPARELPPSMGEIQGLLHRIREPARPPAGADLYRLGRLLAVDYLLLVHRAGEQQRDQLRLSLYSVNLRALAPREAVVSLPGLGGLTDYLTAETDGGQERRRWCPTCSLRWADFTLEHYRQASLRVTAGTWLKRIGGFAQLDAVAMVPDDRINLVTDLGLDRSYTFAGRLEYQPWNRHRFRFGYTPSHFGGRMIMDHTTRLNQKLIAVHELIETEVDIDFYELTYFYDLLRRKMFTLSVGGEVRIVDALFYLKDLGNVVTGGRVKQEAIEKRQTYPVPFLCVRVEFFPLRMLGFVGEVKGFTAGRLFTDVDVELGGQINLFRHMSLFFGYRYTRFDLEVLGQALHFAMDGPQLTLSFNLWTGPFK